MTSIAKLKDKARKHEQKEDWQAAIEVYQRVLDQQEEEEDLDLDLSLFNRIGDLNLRLGQTDEAVSYYETAADKYAESGFYNNAIALCNKALRHRPDRPAIYLKLSRLCTEQGFQTDARRWILEYAEREVAMGQVEAALTGLEEFADLSDDPEVRELLAQQLATHEREGEAVEQLRLAYGMRVQAGEMEKAEEVAEKARAIDPGVELEAEAPPPTAEPVTDELPGLGEPAVAESEAVEAGDEVEGEAAVEEEAAVESAADDLGVEPTVAEETEEPADEPAAGLEGLETRTETVEATDAGGVGLEGLESTAAAADPDEETEAGTVSGLEVSYSEQAPPATSDDAGASLGDLETFDSGATEPEAGEEEVGEGQVGEDEVEWDGAADSEGGTAEMEPVEAEPGAADFEDEEEAEPLPLLDTGYEDEAAEEADELEVTGEGGGLEGIEEAEGLEEASDVEDVEEAEPVEPVEPVEAVEAAAGLEEAEEVEGLEEAGEAGGVEEAEPAEEVEPLPLVDTGYEDLPDDEAVEPPTAVEDGSDEVQTLGDLEDDMIAQGFEVGEEPATDAGEEEAGEEEAGGLDLSFAGSEEAVAEEEEEPGAGPDEDAMDLDLGSFDLGFESSDESAPEVEVEDLDVDATLTRARELVSRGLTSEALRELHLLSSSDAGPEVFRDALTVVNEIVRHDENDISALQRRVEYGARIGERATMVEAYLDLAEALERLGAETKSRVMYERALDLDPSNETAREALGVRDEAEEEETIDLDAILREMEPEEMETTRQNRSSDPNFAAMLDQFKAKVTENVDPDDAGDHYDLGLAFKEMGLIDEAIAEFQTALTGGEERLKVYEELGQCFVLKGQYNVALKVFDRALKVPHTDEDELLGVYYHMGQCHEELGERQRAKEAYEKVLSIDETFADVPDRMARL